MLFLLEKQIFFLLFATRSTSHNIDYRGKSRGLPTNCCRLREQKQGRHVSSSSLTSSSFSSEVVILESSEYPHISRQLGEELQLPVVPLSSSSSSDDHVVFPESTTHALVVLTDQRNDYFDAVTDVHLDGFCLGLCTIQNKNHKNNEQPRKQSGRRKQLRFLSKPFIVDMDFSDRRSSSPSGGGGGVDLLIRAVQPRGKIVYDVTAGWGRDAGLLAHAGAHQVHMMERNPIVHALLRDALRRLQIRALAETTNKTKNTDGSIMNGGNSENNQNDPKRRSNRSVDSTISQRLSQCLSLECGDAIVFLRKTLLEMNKTAAKNDDDDDDTGPPPLRPDVIYLDPMFPKRRKSASVKKDMQLLHGLLGSQQQQHSPSPLIARGKMKEDKEENDDNAIVVNSSPQCFQNDNENDDDETRVLLQLALQVARLRVVVKRPMVAYPILSSPTLFQIVGTNSRWDVYTIHSKHPTNVCD